MTQAEFLGKTYRTFIAKYGDLPVYQNYENPDPQKWTDNPDYFEWAYRMDDISYELKYGYFYSPTCFMAHDVWSEADAIRIFKESYHSSANVDLEMIEEYKARQWAYYHTLDFENFQENTEIVSEGIIEIREYYPDNTLNRRLLIDQYTGELMYEANYVRGQYQDPDSGKTRSYLKFMDRFQNGKYVAAERKKVNERVRWVITAPFSLAGKTLEQLYINAIYKNAKRTKRANQ
jgi:hypothetical protein